MIVVVSLRGLPGRTASPTASSCACRAKTTAPRGGAGGSATSCRTVAGPAVASLPGRSAVSTATAATTSTSSTSSTRTLRRRRRGSASAFLLDQPSTTSRRNSTDFTTIALPYPVDQ